MGWILNRVNYGAILVSAMAIASIAFLEIRALERGIDGTSFSLAVAAIAGIAGFQLNKITKERSRK